MVSVTAPWEAYGGFPVMTAPRAGRLCADLQARGVLAAVAQLPSPNSSPAKKPKSPDLLENSSSSRALLRPR